jgi:hypothetical protein
LARVPLGPRPSLHPLRHRCSGFVRRLLRYYGGVRLLGSVHHRLRLFTFPMRTNPVPRLVSAEISRFPCEERACMPGSTTTPGRLSARVGALRRVAFRYTDSVGTRKLFSIAAQWLAYTYPYRRFADTLTSDCARLGGRCGSLNLHRSGLAPPIPCRSPGASCVKTLMHAMGSPNRSKKRAPALPRLGFWA